MKPSILSTPIKLCAASVLLLALSSTAFGQVYHSPANIRDRMVAPGTGQDLRWCVLALVAFPADPGDSFLSVGTVQSMAGGSRVAWFTAIAEVPQNYKRCFDQGAMPDGVVFRSNPLVTVLPAHARHADGAVTMESPLPGPPTTRWQALLGAVSGPEGSVVHVSRAIISVLRVPPVGASWLRTSHD